MPTLDASPVRPNGGAASVAARRPRAGVTRRLAASLYDALLLAALALLVEFALLPLLPLLPLTPLVATPAAVPAGNRALLLPGPAAQAMSFGCIFAALGLYCVWSWSCGRSTLPMKTWRIAIESAAGGEAGIARAALRYLAWWIGPSLAVAAYVALRPSGHARWAVALLAFNYAWALINVDRQFLHDHIAGTRLIVAPRAARA